MTVQAQNALLKTIEEPPAYAILLLLTTNADLFLPDDPVPVCAAEIKAPEGQRSAGYLVQNMGEEESQADIYAAFAGGIWEKPFIWPARRSLSSCIRKSLSF